MEFDARAIIRWVPASRGGRQRPPAPATGYSSPARFESDPQHESGWWSLWITSSSEIRGTEVIDARVRFHMPDAPHQLLAEGERFEMLEGDRVVAKGVIVPAAIPIPDRISEFELALLG